MKLIGPLFLAVLAVLSPLALEAMGFGKTQKVFEYEDASWQGVYCDFGGVKFTASIPDYTSGTFSSESATNSATVTLRGVGATWFFYDITAVLDPYLPPRTSAEFVEEFQEVYTDYPGSQISVVEAKQFGAKFVLDVIIPCQGEGGGKDCMLFNRVVCTGMHLIVLSTNDANENRRNRFFEGIRIQK